MVTLEYGDGCTMTTLNANGVETIDMTMEDLKLLIHKIVDKIDDVAQLQRIFMDFVECNGEEVSSGYCDECGDHWYIYKTQIEDDDLEKMVEKYQEEQ